MAPHWGGAMNERMNSLRQRRGELLVKIDLQRGQLAELGARWEGSLALADHGLEVLRILRAHPLLVAGITAVVVSRRRGVMALIRGALRIWKGYRLVAGLRQRL